MAEPVVYLDNNASTRADPRVIEAALPFLAEQYGNASSMHHFGAAVMARVEQARAQVARAIRAREAEIVFTSGGTESNNAALRGVLAARPDKRHVVISAVEHHAILEPAEQLQREGFEVTRIGVDGQGRLDLAGLEGALREDTALVSVMLANNETGVIFPLCDVACLTKPRGIPLHTDAVNAFGKIDINVDELGADLLSLSAHKVHGLKGCGALYVRRAAPWRPLIVGGPQERQRRGGTLNSPGIVAFGRACELLATPRPRVRELRDRLEREIVRRCPNTHVIAAETQRTPNTLCVCFAGVAAEPIVLLLSEAGICVSSGAACSSGSLEPSHVLQAMGIDPFIAQGQIRFSLSRFTTEAEVDRVLEVLPGLLAKVAAVNA